MAAANPENATASGSFKNPDPGLESKQLQKAQSQVDEVMVIMHDNVEKVLQRDEKITELGERAEAIQKGASQFEKQALKLEKKMWWQNFKMTIILGGMSAVVLIVFVYLLF